MQQNFVRDVQIFSNSLRYFLIKERLLTKQRVSEEPQIIGNSLSVHIAILDLLIQVSKYLSSTSILFNHSDQYVFSSIYVLQRTIYEGIARSAYIFSKKNTNENKRVLQLYFGQGLLEHWADAVNSPETGENYSQLIAETIDAEWFLEKLKEWNLEESEFYNPIDVFLCDSKTYLSLKNLTKEEIKVLRYKDFEGKSRNVNADNIWPKTDEIRKVLIQVLEKNFESAKEYRNYLRHVYKYTSSFVHPNVSNSESVLEFDDNTFENDIVGKQVFLIRIITYLIGVVEAVPKENFIDLHKQVALLHKYLPEE